MSIRLDNITTKEQEKAAADEISNLIKRVAQRRQDIVETWLLNHETWKNIRSKSFFLSPTFNHSIPAVRRVIERFAIRGTQMLLPRTEFFEVVPANPFETVSEQKAPKVISYMDFLIRRRLKMRSIVKQLLRCYQLYGRAITKVSIKTFNVSGGTQVWPFMRPVDPFMFLIWPETCPDLESAQMVSEDCIIPYDQYVEMAKTGGADPINQSDLISMTWPDHIERRLQTKGITKPDDLIVQGDDRKKLTTDFVFLTECWFNHGDHWRFCWIVNNYKDGPVMVKNNGTKFLRPDYRMTISREIPGEQYTSSSGDDLTGLQTLFTDQINVAMEGMAMAVAPPTAVDPNLVSRISQLVYKVRAIWHVPPDAVKVLDNKGENVGRFAIAAASATQNMIDTYGGSSPLAEGQPTRNLPRAGFAVSSLTSLALADIKDAVTAIEDDILTPSMMDMYQKAITYTPKNQLLRIPGASSAIFRIPTRISDIEGDWDMHWIGSQQQQDQEEVGQRIGAMADSIARLQNLSAELAQQGKRINWTHLFTSWWRKSIGEREFSKIIEDIQPGEGEQAIPGQTTGSPAQPGSPNPQIDNLDELLSRIGGT